MRIWVPDASPWSPDVVPPAVLSGLLAAPPPVLEPDPGKAEALDDRPSTAMAFPSAVTEAFTGTRACVPDPMLCRPEVEAGSAPAREPPEPFGPEPLPFVDELPSTEMALPPTSSGALTGATTWVPEPAPR